MGTQYQHGVQGVPSSNLGAPTSLSKHRIFTLWTLWGNPWTTKRNDSHRRAQARHNERFVFYMHDGGARETETIIHH